MRPNRNVKPLISELEKRWCLDATVVATVTGVPTSGDYGNPPPVVVSPSPIIDSPPYGPLGGDGTSGGGSVSTPSTPTENQAPSGPVTVQPVYDNPPTYEPPPVVVIVVPVVPPEPTGPQQSLGYPGMPYGTGENPIVPPPTPSAPGGSGDYGNVIPGSITVA